MKKFVQLDSVPVKLLEDTAKKVQGLTYPFQRKAVAADIKDIDPTTRTEVSVIASNVLDRDNEIVLVEGIELDDFRRNPVVLFNHDQGITVGNAQWIKTDGDKLLMKTYFPERPQGYEGEWDSDKCWAKIACKPPLLIGKSIGFIPIEIREPTPEELQRHPACERVIARSLLLEVSCVSVPSNPDALLDAINKGIIPIQTLKTRKAGKDAPITVPVVPIKQKPKRKPLELDANRITELVLKALKGNK